MAKSYAAINLMATTARGVEAFEIEDHPDASFENCLDDFRSCLRSMDDDEVRFYQILPAGTDGEWEKLDDEYGIKTVSGPTANAVKTLRVRAGLTQEQAAREISATRRAWQEWEAGRRNMPPAKWELFQQKIKGKKTMSDAKKFFEMYDDVADLMTALDASRIESDQDWDNEATTWTFSDGSKIMVSGHDAEVIE